MLQQNSVRVKRKSFFKTSTQDPGDLSMNNLEEEL